ncbi:DNA-binding protein [Nocardia mangyaensis]|uniref:DNA-binding protein n=1 Tax=Nocardia mangyaensis TaxID=2213200 RepID=UPI002675FC7D|nr:DNA-binding protein [Nocardia mangyaensis]MDO3648172.1 DNA-binding protein [Nocardia mangyaensis]
MSKKRPKPAPVRAQVFDSEALSRAVAGDRAMIARIVLAAELETTVMTSPMTLVEAHDGRTSEHRWDWVLSKLVVADLGKEQARAARKLLASAGLHGHKYAIDSVLAVVANSLPGDVTVYTSDVDDLERLVDPRVVVQGI